jgi:alcohol dehydrogenase
LFHVPHGISNAMLLPAVLEFSKDNCVGRLADLGRIFHKEKLKNEEAAEAAVLSVKKLCAKLGIPNLKGWGIGEEAFAQSLSKMAKDAIESGSPANNPRVPSMEELIELYMACYDYPLAAEETSRGHV